MHQFLFRKFIFLNINQITLTQLQLTITNKFLLKLSFQLFNEHFESIINKNSLQKLILNLIIFPLQKHLQDWFQRIN